MDFCNPNTLSKYLTVKDDSAKRVSDVLCKTELKDILAFMVEIIKILDFDGISQMVSMQAHKT